MKDCEAENRLEVIQFRRYGCFMAEIVDPDRDIIFRLVILRTENAKQVTSNDVRRIVKDEYPRFSEALKNKVARSLDYFCEMIDTIADYDMVDLYDDMLYQYDD